ncbi:receptor-like protein kinase [Gossypium australe]|uniref:Receptor-like protein kinase n=1 Tax=Gossypium australe TaxID=47621 RepID=A0A5B6X161_9ROSI|nr:receptor-like protein kinase [Gossypium australe]
MILVEEIEVQRNLNYKEESVEILASEVKELRCKRVPLVKVLWCNNNVEEATWELEETMKCQYPYLFPEGENCNNLVQWCPKVWFRVLF